MGGFVQAYYSFIMLQSKYRTKNRKYFLLRKYSYQKNIPWLQLGWNTFSHNTSRKVTKLPREMEENFSHKNKKAEMPRVSIVDILYFHK